MYRTMTLLLACLLGTTVAEAAEPQTETRIANEEHRSDPWSRKMHNGLIQLEWQDLIPDNFNPDTLFDTVVAKYGIDELDDEDPRTEQIQAEIRRIWNHAPLVESLNGRRVRLPGLVVPLESNGKQMSEFLLVPYYGACIHVPPPPSNQIVYVKTGKHKTKLHEMFEAVWVTGTLLTEHQHKEIGDAGYTLEAQQVEPYE